MNEKFCPYKCFIELNFFYGLFVVRFAILIALLRQRRGARMTRPLTLLIMGDVAGVSSLSDSSLGSLGSWSATGSLLMVSSATSLDESSCNGVSCLFRISLRFRL